MARPRLYIRTFLNRPGHHAGAHIIVTVERVASQEGTETVVFFKVTDCFDSITLDFDMDTPSNRRNSIHKACVLRDALTRLVDVLEAESAAVAPGSGRRRPARVR